MAAPLGPQLGDGFHPVGERLLVLLCVSAAVGAFAPTATPAPFTFRDVQEWVRRATGTKPSAIEAASACRAAADKGLLRRLGRTSSYVVTRAGEDLRDEIHALSRRSLGAYASRIEALLPEYAPRAAQQIRFHLMSTVNRLVGDLVRTGAVFRDESIGGIVADLASLPTEQVAEAVGLVPAKFRRAVRLLLDVASSGDDSVMRMAVAHVTGIKFCELAIAGRLRNRLAPEDLARLGGLLVIAETSAIVAMAETPARLEEGKACFGDAITHGFRVEILEGSITEYLTGLDDADVQLSALARRVVEVGDNVRLLSWERWWVARAAIKHGIAPALFEEARQDTTAAVLPAAAAFVQALRTVPQRLVELGVRVVRADSVSSERAKHWRSAVSTGQNRPVWDARVVHDADLMGHLQARRRRTPLAFVVSTDTSLRLVWSTTMGPQAHGQPPATCLPPVASRLLVGMTPSVPVASPWQERSDAWALPVAYVGRAVDLDASPGVAGLFDDQDLLVPDHGLVDGDGPHPLCGRIHELVDDARSAVQAVVGELDRAVQEPVEPIVEEEAGAGPVSPDVDTDGTPERLQRPVGPLATAWRKAAGGPALVVAWVVRLWVASLGRMIGAVGAGLRGLSASQRFAVGLGLVLWTAAGARFSQSGSWSWLVTELIVSTLAVWSVAFVVLRTKR